MGARRRRRADEPGDPHCRRPAPSVRRARAGGTATRLHSIEVEDTAAAVLEFESGALGIIEAATSVFPGYSRRVEVTGSEGTLVLDQDRLVRADLRTPLDGLTEATAGTTESATSPVVSDVTPHRRILKTSSVRFRPTGRQRAMGARVGGASQSWRQSMPRRGRDKPLTFDARMVDCGVEINPSSAGAALRPPF